MRKIIILAIAAMLTLGFGLSYAQGGMGGGGKGPGGPGVTGVPGQGLNLPPDFKPVTKEQADKLASGYVAEKMKGYKIISSAPFQGKRYTGYMYTVQNEAGERYNIMVNARGIVNGPFPLQQ